MTSKAETLKQACGMNLIMQDRSPPLCWGFQEWGNRAVAQLLEQGLSLQQVDVSNFSLGYSQQRRIVL